MRPNIYLPARLWMCAAAVAGLASLLTVTIPGSASASTPLTVKCTKATGNSTKQTITGCSGSGISETGTSGASTVASSERSDTIRWKTGRTTVESIKYTSVTNQCPAVSGYKKVLEASEVGSVTGGTATGLKGGKVSGKFCAYMKSTAYLVNNLGPIVI